MVGVPPHASSGQLHPYWPPQSVALWSVAQSSGLPWHLLSESSKTHPFCWVHDAELVKEEQVHAEPAHAPREQPGTLVHCALSSELHAFGVPAQPPPALTGVPHTQPSWLKHATSSRPLHGRGVPAQSCPSLQPDCVPHDSASEHEVARPAQAPAT
jgi:hypothetical protein